jgi:hypothetical protein
MDMQLGTAATVALTARAAAARGCVAGQTKNCWETVSGPKMAHSRFQNQALELTVSQGHTCQA